MKKVLRNEDGFTLIEIIAVLVILGVLAAVAVPKYLSLMADSKKKAVEGAIAAGASNVSMQFGSKLLTTGNEQSALNAAISVCTASLTDLGDYTATYAGTSTASTGSYTVTVVDKKDAAATSNKTFKAY